TKSHDLGPGLVSAQFICSTQKWACIVGLTPVCEASPRASAAASRPISAAPLLRARLCVARQGGPTHDRRDRALSAMELLPFRYRDLVTGNWYAPATLPNGTRTRRGSRNGRW